MSARQLPTGAVTFLFTDIEGSTKLVQALAERYRLVHEAHNRILRAAFEGHSGVELRSEGDSFFYVFDRARDALLAAVEAQRALAAHDWPDGTPVKVRIGMHTGDADIVGAEYVGVDVWRAARIADAANGGQIFLSSTTKDLAGQLPGGLGIRDLGPHRLKDLERDERLWQVAIDGLPADARLPRTLTALPNNLPLQLTSFVGREEEIASVRTMLGENRLVTLTGAGGSGKTRLAIETAMTLLQAFPDGIWLVDLAPLSDPALVPQAFADAVGAGATRGSTEALEEVLSARELLLIVDNCEHLLDATCDLVELILKRAPNVDVLATSREPLGFPGEAILRVRSLSVPDESDPIDRILGSAAAALFIERATLARRDFNVTPGSAIAIAEICRRLDGIPLAIELAAARVKSLTPAMIADRLDDAFRLLAGSGRGSLERQQTLRALVDWSHRLLDQHEQILFRRLSVFVGGFTLEAAEAVCGGEGIDPFDVIDLLSKLVDRSMVLADEAHQGIRYRMLETLRQYGREKLVDAGESDTFRARHRAWFTDLASPLLDDVVPDAKSFHERLREDLDNVRAALEFGLDRLAPEDVEPVGRLAAALVPYWNAAMRTGEGHRWLTRALAVPNLDRRYRAHLLRGQFWLAPPGTPIEEIDEMLAEAEREATAVGDHHLAVHILLHRARQYFGETGGEDFIEQALARARAHDDRSMVARALTVLALRTASAGSQEEALSIAAEAEAQARGSGDISAIAFSVSQRGRLAWFANDHETSEQAVEEWLTLAEQLPGSRDLITAHFRAGWLKWRDGDRAGARAHWMKQLELLEDAVEVPPGSRQHRAIAAIDDEMAYAHASLTRSAELLQRLGDWESVSMALEGIGLLLVDSRDFAGLANAIQGFRDAVSDGISPAHDLFLASQQAAGHALAGEVEQAVGIVEPVRDRVGDGLMSAYQEQCEWWTAVTFLAAERFDDAAVHCLRAIALAENGSETPFTLCMLRALLQTSGEPEAAALAAGRLGAEDHRATPMTVIFMDRINELFPPNGLDAAAMARGAAMTSRDVIEIGRRALANHAPTEQVQRQPEQQDRHDRQP